MLLYLWPVSSRHLFRTMSWFYVYKNFLKLIKIWVIGSVESSQLEQQQQKKISEFAIIFGSIVWLFFVSPFPTGDMATSIFWSFSCFFFCLFICPLPRFSGFLSLCGMLLWCWEAWGAGWWWMQCCSPPLSKGSPENRGSL